LIEKASKVKGVYKMYNYYLAGLFVKHHGRLPKDKKELAKFILFGGTIK